MNTNFLFVGTYTQTLDHVDGQADGIYCCELSADGSLSIGQTITGIENPSYLTLSSNKKFLYAVQEGTNLTDSLVFAYAVNEQTGQLTFLNSERTEGVTPCHLYVDAANRYLFVANYAGGNIIVYPLAENGRIQPPTDNIQHQGQGTHRKRQEAAHAHMVLFSPDNQYLLVADLGIDAVLIYKFDPDNGKLHLQQQVTAVNPGAGPRHMAFHPNGRILFVCNELDNTITSFTFENGSLTPIQTVSTLPKGWTDHAGCGAIRVGENGRFVYVSNRGPDNIATFQYDEESNQLALSTHTPTQGKTPRDFILLNNTMLVANQDSNTVVHFHLESGVPKLSGTVSQIPTPVCLAR